MTIDYLTRLKNYSSAGEITVETYKRTEKAPFVTFGGSGLRAFEIKRHSKPSDTPGETHANTGLNISECPKACTDKTVKTPACNLAWLRAQGCAVLPADVTFIKQHLPRPPELRTTILRAYVTTWLEAMAREPLQQRRDNRGRFTANTLLREGKLYGSL